MVNATVPAEADLAVIGRRLARQAALASAWGRMPEGDRSAVPAWFMPAMISYLGSLGFGFRLSGDMPDGLYGDTDWASPRRMVTIRGGMTAADTARVTVHEAAHATEMAGRRVPRNAPEVFTAALEKLSEGDTPELVAESAAGIVTGALGISDGRFTLRYLADYGQRDYEAISAAQPRAVVIAGQILGWLSARQA